MNNQLRGTLTTPGAATPDGHIHNSIGNFGFENNQSGMQQLADQSHFLDQQLHFKVLPPQQLYQSFQGTLHPHQDTHLPQNQQTNILQHPHLQYQQQQQEFRYQSPFTQPNPSNSQKQSLPAQQQIQQQLQQQQEQQPKQILQNPLHASKAVPGASQPIYQTSPQTQQPITAQTSEDVTNKSNKVEDKPSNNGLNQETENNALEKSALTDNTEKTPLCLLNELANFYRFNQQFVLVSEHGPAHKKTFQIKLRLADHEYYAYGESIKKAQNAAAAIALKELRYLRPPPKLPLYNSGNKRPVTKELQTLALKRGETIVYKTVDQQQLPYCREPAAVFIRNYSMRYDEYMHTSRDPFLHGNGGFWPHRPQYSSFTHAFYVIVCVGKQEFLADGYTRQEARHNAERKALGILKNLPIPNKVKKEQVVTSEKKQGIYLPIPNKVKKEQVVTSEKKQAPERLKSDISVVYEIAYHRNMAVNFEVTTECGLPHLKKFVVKCTVGHLVTEGSGNNKRSSKQIAAKLMLEELMKLPCVFSRIIPKRWIMFPCNRRHNLRKQHKVDPYYGSDVHPISRLVQITQAKKQKDPVYTVVCERESPVREFVIQVNIEDKTCTGTGRSKKLAKRCAAEAMLQILCCNKPEPLPVKSALKHSLTLENNQSGDKRVKFVDSSTSQPSTTHQVIHQRIPGLLHLPSGSIKPVFSSAASDASSQSKESQNHQNPESQLKGQLDDLCESFNHEMNISDLSEATGKNEVLTSSIVNVSE